MDGTTKGQLNPISEQPKPTLLEYIAKAVGSPQMGALIALSAALTLGVGLVLWSIKPNFTPVFEQLDRQDVVQVLEVLRADNIPYEIQSKTGIVLVPHDQVDMIRMKLAASGIPSSTSVGFELLQQEQSLGTSQFMETSRYQHALETELSRTISSMRNIDSARVHLGLPKQSIFIRNRAKATASVMVKLFPGRSLEDGQVAAIANLIASGIPYLESDQVTIVDQWGKLFTTGGEASESGEVQKQFDYTRRLETLYSNRVEQLLSSIIGQGNVRATVTADLDFSVNEQTQELFEGDKRQIRSEQQQDQQSRNLAAIGIPGALTNQPPGGGTTNPPENEPNNEEPLNTSSNSTKNYELDKTITHSRKASGAIRQISVAVLVNDSKTVDEEGEVTVTARTPEEIEQYKDLVKEAIGFNQARGDSVVVINHSFKKIEEIAPLEPLPLWEQSWFWAAAKQVLAGLSVLVLIVMVVLPAMRNLKTVPHKEILTADESGEEIKVSESFEDGSEEKEYTKLEEKDASNSASLEAPQQVYGDILNLARAMADEDPKRVAKVVRDWVGATDG